MYSVLNIGYEYMKAEECLKAGYIDEAIKHFELAIANYENADDEYKLSPNSSYTIEEYGEKLCFPSINTMISKSYKRLQKLKSKRETFI